MRRYDPLVLFAAALGVAGLILLVRGLVDGVPFVYWGTTEERAARDFGRVVILGASALVIAAGVLVSIRRSLLHGIAVAAVGPATATLTFVLPGTAWPWLAFLILSLVALGAWVGAVGSGSAGRRG